MKTMSGFGNDDATRKAIWLTMRRIVQKWKRRSPVWATAMKEKVVMYGERFTQYLN